MSFISSHARIWPGAACRALGFLVFLAGCGAGAPEIATEAGPIRLVELLDRAEVRWGAEPGAEPPGNIPGAKVRRDRAGRLVRVRMSDTDGRSAEKRWNFDDRLALLAPTGTSYRFALRLPEEAYLQLGLGAVSAPEGVSQNVRFTVKVTPPRKENESPKNETILDEVLTLGPEGLWQDRELSLRPWSGEEVTVHLETASEGEDPPLWTAWSAPEVVSGSRRDEGFNVLLISLDTLRADHLGCYGYPRPTSPAIDALAARGTRFATAVSQSPWTKPSHRALLTGLYPTARQGLISPPLSTVLWRAGYRTLAMTGGGQVHPRFGFGVGFEIYRVEDWVRSISDVVERLERGRGRKQFLFLHTYEIHDPYLHTSFAEGLPSGRVGTFFSKRNKDPLRLGTTPTEEEKAFVKALYDSGIAFVDERLGELFAELTSRGILERTIVVITSDHGEQFWEHRRWGHGTNVYDHQLLVPLIFYLPPALRRELTGAAALPGRVVREQVRLIDIYPTLLDLLDLPLSHRVQGRSLKPLLAGRSLPEAEALAENTSMAVEFKALRSPRLKLIYSFHKREKDWPVRLMLFDLLKDPEEKNDLAEAHPELVDELFGRMREMIRGETPEEIDQVIPEDLDPKLRERLEALGYLGQ